MLTRRTSTTQSAQSAGTDDVPAEPLTLPEQFDFSNVRTVGEAHARLAHAPALDDLRQLICDGVDLERIRDALATLILYQCAEERQQRSDTIPGTRDGARETLAAHLSPAGKDKLLQTLEFDAVPDAIPDALSETVRWGVAGHVHLRDAAAASETKPRSLAFGLAGHAFERAELPGRAAHAWTELAQTLQLAGAPREAARAWLQTAVAYAEADMHETAAITYRTAADCFTLAMESRHAAYALCAAATACLQAGLQDTAIARFGEAGDHYTRAAETCVLAGQRDDASELYREAAACLTRAAHALTQAAQATSAEATWRTAERSWRAAATAHAMAGQPDSAGQAEASACDAAEQAARSVS